MSCSEVGYTFNDIVKGNDFTGLELTFYNGVGVGKTPMNLTGYNVVIDFKKSKGLDAVFSFKTSDNTILIPIKTNGQIFLQGLKMNYPAGTYTADVNLINPTGKLRTYTTVNWKIIQNV